MICPHCKKSIKRSVDNEAIKKGIKLVMSGHSLRDAEKILFKDGYQISFATLSRALKKLDKPK